MGRDAGHFCGEHADGLTARRHFQFSQPFDRDGIGHVVRERRNVIQPVRIRHELIISHVLRDLLIAAMQVTNHRISLSHNLAIEFKLDAQHAVSGRMGRPHR